MWLAEPGYAMAVIIVADVWKTAPFVALLVLAGLWLAVRFVRGAGPVTGIFAGLLLGGVMTIRVDAFLAAAAIPLLFGYELLVGRPAWRWLYPGVPLAFFAGLTLL